MPSPLIQDVLHGIGTTKSASAALSNGLSMPTKSAFPSLINALLMLTTVLVFHASKDTILRTEPVLSLHSTMLSPLIPDVPPGIGTIKSALAAQRIGPSMPTKSAFQFLTNALLMLTTVLASHASRDTTSKKELAFSLHSITPSPLIPDVPHGIGITKSALFAH